MRKRIILERMGKRCFANIAGKSWKMMPRFVRIAVRPSRMRRRRCRSLRSRTPDRTNSCSTGRPYGSRAHRAHRTLSRRDSTGRISTGKTNTDSSLNRFRPITISPLSIRSNGIAIAGFVCAFISPLLGWIFGGIGLSRANRRNGKGKGFSIAAIVVASVVFVSSFISLMSQL